MFMAKIEFEEVVGGQVFADRPFHAPVLRVGTIEREVWGQDEVTEYFMVFVREAPWRIKGIVCEKFETVESVLVGNLEQMVMGHTPVKFLSHNLVFDVAMPGKPVRIKFIDPRQ